MSKKGPVSEMKKGGGPPTAPGLYRRSVSAVCRRPASPPLVGTRVLYGRAREQPSMMTPHERDANKSELVAQSPRKWAFTRYMVSRERGARAHFSKVLILASCARWDTTIKYVEVCSCSVGYPTHRFKFSRAWLTGNTVVRPTKRSISAQAGYDPSLRVAAQTAEANALWRNPTPSPGPCFRRRSG